MITKTKGGYCRVEIVFPFNINGTGGLPEREREFHCRYEYNVVEAKERVDMDRRGKGRTRWWREEDKAVPNNPRRPDLTLGTAGEPDAREGELRTKTGQGKCISATQSPAQNGAGCRGEREMK
jgi:hypothetical protein